MLKGDDCRNCKLCRLNQLLILNHNSFLYKPNTPSATKTSPIMASQHKSDSMGRSLRLIALALWIPGLLLLMPHGILSHSVFPAIGLLPLTLSAVVATITLLARSHQKHGEASRSSGVILLSDFLLAVFHIGVLIITWVTISQYWCGGSWQPYNSP